MFINQEPRNMKGRPFRSLLNLSFAKTPIRFRNINLTEDSTNEFSARNSLMLPLIKLVFSSLLRVLGTVPDFGSTGPGSPAIRRGQAGGASAGKCENSSTGWSPRIRPGVLLASTEN
jgi:hypothetical protein